MFLPKCVLAPARARPHDLKQTYAPVAKPEVKEKKVDDLDNMDDVASDGVEDDIISLDDQKEIEDSNEEFKPD